jgi:hypothetical protein
MTAKYSYLIPILRLLTVSCTDIQYVLTSCHYGGIFSQADKIVMFMTSCQEEGILDMLYGTAMKKRQAVTVPYHDGGRRK